MGLKDKFAESFARSKTMTGPEKKANEIMGKLILKKGILPLILILLISIVGMIFNIAWYITFGLNLIIAIASYFYIKKASEKYQNFKPYVGNLISIEKKGKKDYVAIIKQGKMPIKLEIAYGGDDFEKVKKNQLIQVSYNPDAKIAVLINK